MSMSGVATRTRSDVSSADGLERTQTTIVLRPHKRLSMYSGQPAIWIAAEAVPTSSRPGAWCVHAKL
jgi:hypothetical protein